MGFEPFDPRLNALPTELSRHSIISVMQKYLSYNFGLSSLYTVSGKKSLHFFLNNFNKCEFALIIFGTHYHNDTLY